MIRKMKEDKNKFELIYEQSCKLDSAELNRLRGGAPDGCITVSVGVVVCGSIIIGKAQPE